MAIPRDPESFPETHGHSPRPQFIPRDPGSFPKRNSESSIPNFFYIYMYIYLGMAESKGYTKTMLQVMTSLWPLGAHGTGLLVLTLRTWQIPTNAVH